MANSPSAYGALATRYASALIDAAAADSQQALSAVEADVKALIKLIDQSPEFKTLISSGLMGQKAQGFGIKAILDNAQLNKFTANFLNVLVKNRRLNALTQILSAFGAEMSKRRGEVTAIVESAVPLTAAQEKHLADNLQKTVGQPVQIELRVKPELLGGLVVTIGSNRIDDSLARKLERLKIKLQSQANENTLSMKEAI